RVSFFFSSRRRHTRSKRDWSSDVCSSDLSSSTFEMTVSVTPADIDEQNHVNNTVYLRWVQDVATAHWKSLASAEAQNAIGWVVLRHEIDYRASASLGDQ